MLALLLISLCLSCGSGKLAGQNIDPALMAKFNSLSSAEKATLLKSGDFNKGSQTAPVHNKPTAIAPSGELQEEVPEVGSFQERSKFLSELQAMATSIRSDLNRMESELDASADSPDSELLQTIEETRSLLRKIKGLERREIEKRAEEFLQDGLQASKPFGYDLFAGSPSTFAPGNEVPVPPDYGIGPGDVLEIQLFGRLNNAYSLMISREGLIKFPGIGPINVFEKGTDFLSLKNLIKEKIKDQLGDGVQSSISMGSLRSIRIFLLGDVRKPGAFVVSSLSTITNALLVSGGIKEIGSLRNIQLKRQGKVISRLDLYDLLLQGDTSGDVMVLPGDVIFVPTIVRRATLSGAVLRSAQYELLGGETLSDVIALGGGVDSRADVSGIRLERIGPDGQPLVRNLQLKSDSGFPILSGDLISVPSASVRVRNVVSVSGNVERPGVYEWKKGLRISDLIPDMSALLPGTDYSYALIRREHADGSLSVRQFRVIEIFRDSSSPFNIELEARDAIYFFSSSNSEARERLLSPLVKELSKQSSPGDGVPIVSVSGMVHFPGDYPLSKEMRLSDLLNAAGGMLDAAYALSSELTRMKVKEASGAEIDHVLVPSLFRLDANDTNNIFLQPYDSLNVKPIPSWRERELVEILGEVRFPGSYPIKPGESLSQVVLRAGGLTEQAFSGGAVFSRESLKIKEQEQRDRLIAQLESDVANLSIRAESQSEAQQSQTVASSLLARLKSMKSQGRLVLPSDTFSATNKSSIEVRGGDRLLIPRIPYEVSVVGEVQFPTSHLYEKNLNQDDFVKRSGGFTTNADKDRVFVVRANGSVLSKGLTGWFGGGGSGKGMAAGDVIVVPINMEKSRLAENIVNGTQIVYQLAVAAAAVNSF